MLRKCTAAVLVCLGYSVFAGLVDHGDYTGFPNVNVDAHLTKIARKYYPELAGKMEGDCREGIFRYCSGCRF